MEATKGRYYTEKGILAKVRQKHEKKYKCWTGQLYLVHEGVITEKWNDALEEVRNYI